MPDSQLFQSFPTGMAQNDLEWPILPHSQLFPSFATKASHFWRNLKNFHSWGGVTLANCLSFSTFLNRFTPKQLKMTHNGQFCQKSGLDWLQMANFGHFAGFSIFSSKMRLRLTRNGQFHPIHNFSHLLPPKCLIFGEISKIFIPWGYISKLFEFFNFFKSFLTKVAQNDTQWLILPKKWPRLAPNGQFWSFCRFFYLFPQNDAQIDSEWSISPDSQLFPSFATKASHFWRNLKNFISGGYIGKFLSFSTFSNCFTLKQLKMTHNGQFCQKSGLDWLQMANFGHFCRFFYLFLQNDAQIDLEWPISHDSQLFPPKHLIFGEISKAFITVGGTLANL